MDKVLKQNEIDEMVRAARTSAAGLGRGPERVVQPWDIRQAGQIGAEQLHAINQLHELFARNLSTSIGSYLRIIFDCGLVSAEHLAYREFLQDVPDRAYLASCNVNPFSVVAALQLDLAVAFALIDVMMGGEGKTSDLNRGLTEIEEQILEGVMRIICRDLQNSWQAINVEFNFGACQQMTQAQRLMPPDEKNLCLSFEIKMAETRGTLNFAVPAVVSNALLRKISSDVSYQRPNTSLEARDQIKQRLLNCTFDVELSTPALRVPISDLSELAPGDLLPLARSASAPAYLEVGEMPLGSATPVRVGARRAARVLMLGAEFGPGAEMRAKSDD